MLDEYRQLYMTTADRINAKHWNGITNWQEVNKNDLCNYYLDETDTFRKESYFSAILVKYWGHIQKFFYISKSIATEEDVYEWLVDSIVYALDHASWRNPESSIYNDPNGPDKVINRCMKCRRLTFYQAHNRQKRKGGFGSLSLDEIQENYSENSLVFEDTSTDEYNSEVVVNRLIQDCFKQQKYLTAFIIDTIAYGNSFKLYNEAEDEDEKKEDKRADKEAAQMAKLEAKDPDNVHFENNDEVPVNKIMVFNEKRLEKRLRRLSMNDASYFSKRYQLPQDTVEEKLIKYCMNIDEKYMKNIVKSALEELKLNMLKGNLDVNRFSESE